MLSYTKKCFNGENNRDNFQIPGMNNMMNRGYLWNLQFYVTNIIIQVNGVVLIPINTQYYTPNRFKFKFSGKMLPQKYLNAL